MTDRQRKPPQIPATGRAPRVEHARRELERRGFLRVGTDHDSRVVRDPSGRPTGRVEPPSPRGGVAVVAYHRRGRPGDSTSEGDPPSSSRNVVPDPAGSYSDHGPDPEGPTGPTGELLPPEGEELAGRPGDAPELTRFPPPPPPFSGRDLWREITQPGADPARVVSEHVRVYLEREHVACALVGLVVLSGLAGMGVAALAIALVLVTSLG